MQIIGLIHKISTEPYLGIHDGESFLRAQKSRKLLILLVLVAREGIEPPTRGFSGVSGGLEELINQPLTALATPLPPLTMAQSWHTKSEFDTDSSLVIRRGESSHLSGCLSSPCCSDLLRRPCRFPHTYIGVPCMRATSRAVRALFLKPRPTPSEKLSTFFGRLDRVLKARAPQVSVLSLNSHILSNDPPGDGRYRGNCSNRARIAESRRRAECYDRLAARAPPPVAEQAVAMQDEDRQSRSNSLAFSTIECASRIAARLTYSRMQSPLLPPPVDPTRVKQVCPLTSPPIEAAVATCHWQSGLR